MSEKMHTQTALAMIRRAVKAAARDVDQPGLVFAVGLEYVRDGGWDAWAPYVALDECTVQDTEALVSAIERRWREALDALSDERGYVEIERVKTVYGPTIFGWRDRDHITRRGPLTDSVSWHTGFASIPEEVREWWK